MRNSYAVSGSVLNSYLVRERDRRRLRELALVLLALLPAAAALVGYVWVRLERFEVGYSIVKLENTRQALEERVRTLELDGSYLASPARIEERAVEQLGMRQPLVEQLVFSEAEP